MTGKGGHRDLERRDSEVTWFFSHPPLGYFLLAGATFLSVWVSVILAFNICTVLFILFISCVHLVSLHSAQHRMIKLSDPFFRHLLQWFSRETSNHRYIELRLFSEFRRSVTPLIIHHTWFRRLSRFKHIEPQLLFPALYWLQCRV